MVRFLKDALHGSIVRPFYSINAKLTNINNKRCCPCYRVILDTRTLELVKLFTIFSVYYIRILFCRKAPLSPGLRQWTG